MWLFGNKKKSRQSTDSEIKLSPNEQVKRMVSESRFSEHNFVRLLADEYEDGLLDLIRSLYRFYYSEATRISYKEYIPRNKFTEFILDCLCDLDGLREMKATNEIIDIIKKDYEAKDVVINKIIENERYVQLSLEQNITINKMIKNSELSYGIDVPGVKVYVNLGFNQSYSYPVIGASACEVESTLIDAGFKLLRYNDDYCFYHKKK